MAKLLLIILVTFSFSTNIILCEDACSNYSDEKCVHPDIIKNGYFINQWTVKLPGMPKEEAKLLLESKGFNYLGQILDGDNLYLVTKKGAREKHVLPDERIIELLKKHGKVHSVAQTHVLPNSKDHINNIIDKSEVECLSVDPETIKLNDGSENLQRIQISKSIQGDTDSHTYSASRPISNNYKSDIVNTDQTNVPNDGNNIDGEEKRNRNDDEERENKNEYSNNEKSSNIEGITDEDI